MIYGLQDVVRLRQMIDESPAGEERKRHDVQKLDALLGWCEVTSCRRKPLLAYFGDDSNANCGNCDNCLDPPVTWDGSEAARKLLSAVYRTGQVFGAAHIVDVLLGNETDKVIQHGHARLSVFGIGADLAAQTWRSIVRQLMVQGHLKADARGFGGLMLTQLSRPLLRGEVGVQFREDRKAPALTKKPRRAVGAISAEDAELWEALRECRKRLASEHNVPPYVIFHDATLMQMMEFRPNSANALLGLNGVGQAKLDRYGEDFLAVIREAG
jgi:ATP-dependent DNA helicase RecQ